MGMFNALERAERTNAADLARIDAIQSEIHATELRRAGDISFDELVTADDEIFALRRKLTIAQGVANRSAERLAQAREHEAEKAADVAHAAAEKLANAGEKLTREVIEAAERLATLLGALEGNRSQVNAANAARGSREFIVDGEHRVRSTLGQATPAVTEKNLVWVDVDGNVVKAEIYDPTIPKWVRNPAAVKQVEKVFVIREASSSPVVMPERLASAITLVGKHGERIWPPRT